MVNGKLRMILNLEELKNMLHTFKKGTDLKKILDLVHKNYFMTSIDLFCCLLFGLP